MPRTTKIALEKIVAAQKRLRSLPVKDNRKDPEEALEMLAGDVRNTLQKGYSLKEVRGFISETGVPLSTFMLRKHLEQDAPENASSAQKTEQETPAKDEHEIEKLLPGDMKKTPPVEEKKTPLREIKASLTKMEKTSPAYEGIIVKPDTPDSEL